MVGEIIGRRISRSESITTANRTILNAEQERIERVDQDDMTEISITNTRTRRARTLIDIEVTHNEDLDSGYEWYVLNLNGEEMGSYDEAKNCETAISQLKDFQYPIGAEFAGDLMRAFRHGV